MSYTEAKELSQILKSLETVENNLDEDLHGMLQEDTDLEEDLKAQLRDLESLKQDISGALKLDGHIEELTEKAERHRVMSEEHGLDNDEANDALADDIQAIDNDVRKLIAKFEDITDGIETFKREMKKQENDASTFSDIESEVENLLESLRNAQEDVKRRQKCGTMTESRADVRQRATTHIRIDRAQTAY
jgi:hypothetical protein